MSDTLYKYKWSSFLLRLLENQSPHKFPFGHLSHYWNIGLLILDSVSSAYPG